MKIASFCIGLSLFCSSPVAMTYELATHARLTLSAFNQSSLQSDPTRLRDLGIPSLKYSELGGQYFDVRGDTTRIRSAKVFDYDLGKMPGVEGVLGDPRIPFRVSGWLMRGAIREDDSGRTVGQYFTTVEVEPEDDPDININRWCNHFFDPLTYKPLTDINAQFLCLVETYASAPVWASGAIDPFQSPQQEQTDRRNHFTIYDAREAMWRALTGYDRNQNVVASTGVQRKAYWATTFRSLGDVLHLNQDMAQPQHTRNESHGLRHAGIYEKYIDARAKGDTTFKIDGRAVSPATMAPLIYTGYATPRFNYYSKYWSTAHGGDSSDNGKGLADYSNRGFFTQARNINDSALDYPFPSHDLSKYGSLVIPTAAGLKEEYLTAVVPDKYLNQSSDPIRMTRASMWDDSLIASEGIPTAATYSLDQATYDDRVALLLPRAVGYSAGLLDYVFNGRLLIALPDAGAYAVSDHSTGQGFTKVQLKLTNATPPLIENNVPYPQNMISGTVVAIVKFHYNKCYQSDLSGEYGAPGIAFDTCRDRLPSQVNPSLDFDDSAESIVVSATKTLTLSAGATSPLDFDFSRSPIPLNATDVYLQVAYRGPLGPDTQTAEQDVVVVGTKDISEPTYFSYFNASDYIHIGSKVFTRQDVTARQDLLASVRPSTCVTGSPPNRRLADDCLLPFDLTMKFSFADLNNPAVVVTNLPPRRYLRFAILTDLEPSSTTAAKSTAENSRRLKIRVDPVEGDPGAARDKSLLYQQGICLPLDPIDIVPIRNQLQFESDPPAFANSSESLYKVRGVYGDTQVECVVNGDASAVNANDDREVSMSPLDSNTAEVRPFPLLVSPAFLGP